MSGSCAVAVFALSSSISLLAQVPSNCQVSIAAPPADSRNLFTLAQETELGDAVAESQLLDLRILSEGEPRLQEIAERLVRNTPLAALPIRTFIIEIPQANAFVLPGGRVYVSRALLALIQNEDELAGVLAHEFGHLAAHQQATAISRLMNTTLGVTSLGDRRDIFDKYAELLENIWRKPSAAGGSGKEEKDQMEADRLGLAMQAAAGYDPGAQVHALDRILETNGKTGNFLSNLFNFAPNQKRLAELMKNLPAGCSVSRPAATPEFLTWRKQMLDLTTPQYAEKLPVPKARVTLQPPLKDDLEEVHFSPDGHYLMALDDLGITVLTVQPFKTVFRIPVENATNAGFTPDSTEIVFLSSISHVERWNVASRTRSSAVDIAIREACKEELLSPDARIVACQESNNRLRLLDVNSDAVIFEKKDFMAAGVGFSPDSRYFLAIPAGGSDKPIAMDLKERMLVNVQGDLKKLNYQPFIFLDSGRILATPLSRVANGANINATIYSFPEGKVLSTPLVPYGPFYRAADPNYVIVRPMGKFAAGAVEYSTGRGITSKVPAIDTFGGFHVAERLSGELAIYEKAKEALATEQLPNTDMHRLHSICVSPDLNWIALSVHSRASLWNLRTGQLMTQFQSVDAGYFDANDHLLLALPKFNDLPRRTVNINLNERKGTSGPEIKSPLAKSIGPYLIDIRSDDGKPIQYVLESKAYQDVTVDVQDVLTLKSVWQKHFRGEAPQMYFDHWGSNGVFLWNSTSERVRKDGAFKKVAKQAQGKAYDDGRACDVLEFLRKGLSWGGPFSSGFFVAEPINLATGETTGQPVAIDMVDRCVGVTDLLPLGQSIVVEDNRGRVLIFSGEEGPAKFRFFGRLLDADPVRQRIAVGKELGRAVIYDAQTGNQIEDFHYPAPLVAARFADQGKLLLGITSKQEAITLPVH